jgi:peptidoglycan/LPS O-acetylase OafA/YrhL
MKKASAHIYIPTLNGWRAFSILYVLLFHATWSYFLPAPDVTRHPDLWFYFQNGSFGVYFFFGISGYLITTRLLEERAFFGEVSLKSFYLRRAFRILPIVLTFLFVLTVFKLMGWIDLPGQSIISSILFYRNYAAASSDWYTGHFWSLSIEEHYYLIWPSLFCLIMGWKRAWLPILGILFLVAFWRSLEFRYQILAPHLPGQVWKWRTDLYFDYLMWGSFGAYLNQQTGFRTLVQKFARGWMIFPAIALMHLFLFRSLPLHDVSLAAMIVVCILLTVNFPQSAFSRFLENKWLATIGVYSYSLYVWQQLFLPPVDQRISGAELIQSMPVNLIFLGLVAYASYRFVEIPAINKGKQYLKQWGLERS